MGKFALLLLDLQAGGLNALADSNKLLERITVARHRTKDLGGSTYFVRVGFTDRELDAIPDTNKVFSGVRNARGLLEDTTSSQLDPRVVPGADEPIIKKTRVSAFSTTDLHERLQAQGVQTIVLAGVSTSGVVLSTVRDAVDRDYRIVVLSDCCADPNIAVHEAIVSLILPKHTEVITADKLESGIL
ncbi:cysteine hydrolase family protein [Paraburkholderia caribensis]|uniref:cysteine hydrolase family protein n=1 Tax=Paraburkholderia caribensis TaxID=75105 RepID=UPI001CAF67E0|nr:cysteine hydrolase [Paraburkholderia caribensis]CAG9269671.1 Isochorismatase [Paraburkholderia caribensis]